MFLIGGPAFSGTTLLTHLMNQGNLLCLDEPDFHDPEQSHRGIPFLKMLFPDKVFPERPQTALSYEQTLRLIEQCEKSISPYNLGIKTCDWTFIGHAEAYKSSSYPVIAIVRDIRDALVRPLPDWVTENTLNQRYRLIWNNLEMFDLWLRYEDLVTNPEQAMAKISAVLFCPVQVLYNWDQKTVPSLMLKLASHDLLKGGTISKSRIGIWQTSGKEFSSETHETARMMGY